MSLKDSIREPENIDRVSQISFDLAVPSDVTPEQVREFAEMLQKLINGGNKLGVHCLNGCNDVTDITEFYPMDEVKSIFK
jgi:protein-tyrosine phosphatase